MTGAADSGNTGGPGDWVTVGRVARTHGTRGEVIVNPETDFPERRFECGSRIYLRQHGALRPAVVRACRLHKGRPIIAFEGVETMTEAEQLASCELVVPASELMALPRGTFYHHDLVGCLVVTADGSEAGRVDRVDDDGGGVRLVLLGAEGEVLVPFVQSICTSIDVPGRRIVIDPPDGLLTLNATVAEGHRRDRRRGR